MRTSADRPVLPRDDPAGAPGTVAHAGVDPTREGRALQDALQAAIATHGGYHSWDVDHAGWVVRLSSPEKQRFYGRTVEEALAWRLVWLMAKGTGHPKGLDWGHEIGVGPFLVCTPRASRTDHALSSAKMINTSLSVVLAPELPMDADRFDHLARALHRLRSRRVALRLLASSPLGALAAGLGRREGTAMHFACRHVEQQCRRSRQCCSGRCRNKRCQGHHAGICQLNQDICRQGFDTLCGGTCVCRATTGNAAFCGDGGGQCRNCVRDKECETDFGPGAACVDIGCISPGCGPAGGNTGGKMCMPRCADPDSGS